MLSMEIMKFIRHNMHMRERDARFENLLHVEMLLQTFGQASSSWGRDGAGFNAWSSVIDPSGTALVPELERLYHVGVGNVHKKVVGRYGYVLYYM